MEAQPGVRGGYSAPVLMADRLRVGHRPSRRRMPRLEALAHALFVALAHDLFPVLARDLVVALAHDRVLVLAHDRVVALAHDRAVVIATMMVARGFSKGSYYAFAKWWLKISESRQNLMQTESPE